MRGSKSTVSDGRRLVVLLAAAALIAGVVGPISAGVAQAAPPVSPTDESVIPHYFGPYPNWANSPQRTVDATATIVGDGTGATATATVDPTTGAVTDIALTSPGSGYTFATVEFAGSGTGAAATATVDPSQAVSALTVTEAGSGYLAPPAVTITGGGTPEATATAVMGVGAITIDAQGTGYGQPDVDGTRPGGPPTVEFSLPESIDGVQATGIVDFNGAGEVTGITVIDPGSGYLASPTLTILDGFGKWVGPGTGASASATLKVVSLMVTNPGSGYSAPALVTIDAPATGVAATADPVMAGGVVTGITLDANGSGYVTPGIQKFQDSLPGLCDPATGCPTAPGSKYIPLGMADTTTYPGSDYYEIAVVQYRTQFSSDLPPTLVRGYVQLETQANAGISQHFALANAMLNGPDVPILDGHGNTILAVTPPQYLGPTIVATKDMPVRVLFRNLLPKGVDGDLFLPVDTTLMGSGPGPIDMPAPVDQGTVTDEVRNPMCNEGYTPDMCFTQNRATLHLHGGITPWISDGTPHQWITPAGENTPWPQGVSVQNVPDMPDPGPGAQTFFYTNQQSARLMFYHDHSWGITRLNVYAGEAAGYLVTDGAEQNLVANGTIPGAADTIPLVIQDKTFVPNAAQLAAQDPTWNTARWGGEGSLWTPHVYMPAQNPSDPSGMSGFGRWMYGPWFWPPATSATTPYQPIANPYFDPNCDPNVADFCEPALIPGTPNVSVGMEAFNDTPIVNGTAYPKVTLDPKAYRLRILNAANDRFWNLQWYIADPTTGTLSEVALKPAELAAAQLDPNVFPTPDENLSPPGPDWVQIGTEGGFLPAPAVVSGHQPTTWITDPTRFDVGNVKDHSLLLAPAERADAIVDFSQFAGQTLILYNDAPAAFPARVASYDYYTGDPDLGLGASTTLPGYGPNTRTIMQVTIGGGSNPAFDRTALNAAFAHHANGSGVFESSMDPIIVGQQAYNSAYGTHFVGSGWCSAPKNPSARCDGFVRVNETGNFKFETLAGGTMSMPLEPKAIHDEMNSTTFDEFGRMTANLGLEAPGAHAPGGGAVGGQNIILYPFVNPSTEILNGISNRVVNGDTIVTPIASAGDGTQIWRITHNGVDTHPIHFHLYDVQLINRVTWDNIIMAPEPSELGWKDTVRVSPLQDTIVAVRPIIPKVPFGVLDSHRVLNPMMPEGSTIGFNNTDANGEPITPPITNVMTDFGWEYVYHCHILSHEEMDMMRPVIVNVPHQLALAPDPLTYVRNGGIDLSWTDGTPITYGDPVDFTNWGKATGEVGYRILRADVAADGTVGDYTKIATAPANTTSYHDLVGPQASYSYMVVAFNESGESTSTALTVLPNAPAAPTDLTAVLGASVHLDWVDNANNETSFIVERADNGGAFAPLVTLAADAVSYVDHPAPGDYVYRVAAENVGGTSNFSNEAPITVPVPVPNAPTNLVGVLQSGPQVSLTWADNSTDETGFVIERSINGGAFAQLTTLQANTTAYVDAPAIGFTYTYGVAASNGGGNSPWSNTVDVPVLLPAAPSGLTATVALGQVSLTWTNNAPDATGFIVERSLNGGAFTQVGTPIGTTFQDTTVVVGTTPNTYVYRVRAVNLVGNSVPSNTATIVMPTLPAAPTNLGATLQAGPQVRLVWRDNARNETGFIVERSLDGTTGPWVVVTTVPARNGVGTVNYTDTTVPSGVNTYRVTTVNGAGRSAPSNTVNVTVPNTTPPALSGSAVRGTGNNDIVQLTWVINSTNQTGFRIERSTVPTFATNVTSYTVGSNVTTFSQNAARNRTFYYRIRATFNVVGPSAWSNVITVITP